MKKKKVICVISWRKSNDLQRKFLLLKTTDERDAFWQPVVGGVDAGESFAEAALREAQEETGLSFHSHPLPLGLQYEAQDRRGNATFEQCFHLSLVTSSKEPPPPNLDGKEHQAYGWFSLEEALEKLRFPMNAKAVTLAAQPPLFLSKRGIFFQEGEEITHERTVALFHRSLKLENDRLWVKCGEESLEVIAEDQFRFAEAFDRSNGKLRFLDGKEEVLNPSSVIQRPDHSFLCQRSDGQWAVFLSPVHYEFTKLVREESGKYVFDFLGKVYPIRVSSDGKGMDR